MVVQVGHEDFPSWMCGADTAFLTHDIWVKFDDQRADDEWSILWRRAADYPWDTHYAAAELEPVLDGVVSVPVRAGLCHR